MELQASILAPAIGTILMTLSRGSEMHWTGRGESTAPARSALWPLKFIGIKVEGRNLLIIATWVHWVLRRSVGNCLVAADQPGRARASAHRSALLRHSLGGRYYRASHHQCGSTALAMGNQVQPLRLDAPHRIRRWDDGRLGSHREGRRRPVSHDHTTGCSVRTCTDFFTQPPLEFIADSHSPSVLKVWEGCVRTRFPTRCSKIGA